VVDHRFMTKRQMIILGLELLQLYDDDGEDEEFLVHKKEAFLVPKKARHLDVEATRVLEVSQWPLESVVGTARSEGASPTGVGVSGQADWCPDEQASNSSHGARRTPRDPSAFEP
jgi:hypothetical protein